MSEINFLIFREAFSRASLIPFLPDVAFYAMVAFGTYAMAVPVILASVGSAGGMWLNFEIGRWLHRLVSRYAPRFMETRYVQLRPWIVRIASPALLLCWLPTCYLLGVLAGFFRLPATLVLVLSLIGWGGYYSWLAFGPG